MLDRQRAQWVLFAPVVLGCGIVGWFWLPWNPDRQAALALALALAASGFALDGLPRRLVVATGLLLALGLLSAELRMHATASPRLHHRLTALEMPGTVASVAILSGGDRTRLLLDRDATDIDPVVRLRLSLPGLPPPGLVPGARVTVTAPLGPVPGPTIPDSTDPARRAWFERVAASGRVVAPPFLLERATPGGLDRVRISWADHIASGVGGGHAGAIAVALTVGEQGRMDPQLTDTFRLSGLAHILTVSGFHIAVVVAGIYALTRRLISLWPWLALRVPGLRLAALAAGVAGTFYAIVSGAEVPAVRAAIVAWIALGALALGRNPVSLRLLAFAAFVILLARPEALLGASFQLSFTAVLALVLVSGLPLAQRLADQRHHGLLLRLPRALALMLITSLAIELALMPIAIAHFGRTGVYGALANLLAIPLTGFVIMPLLGAWLVASAAGLGGLVGWALVPAINALAAIATFTAGLPGSSLVVPPLAPATGALLAAGGLMAALLTGYARLAGLPLVAAALIMAVTLPRPDVYVSADGRQVGVVHDGRLHLLRQHRGGYVVNNWAERSASTADRRLHDLPGARCSANGCLFQVSGLRILALSDDSDDAPAPPPAVCAAVDVVIAPASLPSACRPRWQRIDRVSLTSSGAIAITSGLRRSLSVADRAGDRPWSPAALPGMVPSLLGTPRWTGVMVE